jgi:hypothetical protein
VTIYNSTIIFNFCTNSWPWPIYNCGSILDYSKNALDLLQPKYIVTGQKI